MSLRATAPDSGHLHPSVSTTSVAASDTTYHSLYDAEASGPCSLALPAGADMQRQDFGYGFLPAESLSRTPRQTGRRRQSSMSAFPSPLTCQTRPSRRRASGPASVRKSSAGGPRRPARLSRSQPPKAAYGHLPTPEPPQTTAIWRDDDDDESNDDAEPCHSPPPQTTHYWTSDHTRKLEYAAIDAASKGVRGWILKYMVPDCFVPRSGRHLSFDDDAGSVRRYRLELDCDDDDSKSPNEKGHPRTKKLGWLFGD